MVSLEHELTTARLRIVPVTPALAAAARESHGAFARALNAEVPPDWSSASLALVGRSAYAVWGPEPAPMRAIVVHKRANVVIGDVRFEASAQAADEVEIGYEIVPSFRRQGFCTEAASAVVDWLFHEGGAAEIIAGCDRRNVASVKTLRKLGFWLDGSAGRAFWWVLTPELWREMRERF
jgi:RimJ/RimL family protein N-acetyltransferase